MKVEDINLICKVARNFENTTGIEYQELFGEACLGYSEALRTYDSSKGTKLSTWAWRIMNNQLIDFSKYYSKLVVDDSIHVDGLISPPIKNFTDFYEKLSPECKELAKIILANADKIPPKKARGVVVQILRDYGWSWPMIWNSIRNLKLALK
jgi:DNA-directed RNA polymerase specialized sigma subunit